MARGFLGGLLIGGAVSAIGAGVLSVIAFPPTSPEMNTDGPVAQAPVEDTQGTANAPINKDASGGDTLPAAATPSIEAPAPQDSAIDMDVNAPSARPVALIPDTAGAAPDAELSVKDDTVAAITPEDPVSQAQVPEASPAPEPDVAADVSSAPATPAAPDVQPDEPDTAVVEDDAPSDAPADTPVDTTADATADNAAESAQADPAPEEDTAAPNTPPSTLDTATDAEPEQDQDQVAVLVPEAATGSTIGKPATNLLDRQTNSRLPTLGSGDASAETETAQDATNPDASGTGNVVGADETDAPALVKYAQDFADPEGRPLLSIILMDTGQDLANGPVGLEALGSFPYALTFAVDVSLSDATERMAQYRAKGFEVMALVDLPAEATAADTEIALAAGLDAVPEAVAVMEGPNSGLQATRDMSDQVSAIVAASGHGIVWQPKGLDTAQKLAARGGIASQTLFRDFDSADQTPTVIRRFLDQAAFKAGQQGAVIMVGRLRPDTISALLLWGLQDRASRVAVAPVSAVLQQGLGQ